LAHRKGIRPLKIPVPLILRGSLLEEMVGWLRLNGASGRNGDRKPKVNQLTRFAWRMVVKWRW